jgi:hypothetical protein
VLAEGLDQEARGGGLGAVGEFDLDPGLAQPRWALPGGLCARVVGADHDAGDAGLGDRVGARGLPTGVGARLEGHVHRCAGRVLAAGSGILERGSFGVESAELGVEALT